jgi:signal transduction histidine kinase
MTVEPAPSTSLAPPHWSRAVAAALGSGPQPGWYALFDRHGRCIDRARGGSQIGERLLTGRDSSRMLAEVLETGRSSEQHLELVDPRLGPRSFDVMFQPLKQGDDVFGVLLRSTESTGEGTRKTLQRLQAGLLERMEDGVLLSDPLGFIRIATPAAERLVGEPGLRLVGMHVERLDVGAAEAIDAARSQAAPTRWSWSSAGREQRALECRSQRVMIGQQVFVLSVLRDVSEATRLRQKRDQMTRDLHDGLGQDLTGLSLMLRSLERSLEPEQAAQREAVESMSAVVRQLLDDTRVIAQGGAPTRVPLSQLAVALDQLARRSAARAGIDVQCTSTVAAALPASEVIGTNLYRIAQEATTNALRHAGARRIRILFEAADGRLQHGITDDGCGFEPVAAQATGAGLTNMRNRAAAIGAELEIQTGAGCGCSVLCRLDLLREPAPSIR